MNYTPTAPTDGGSAFPHSQELDGQGNPRTEIYHETAEAIRTSHNAELRLQDILTDTPPSE